ncbi:hypothetical protein AGLY_005883 [Aphis glycines]|uniref:Uncharacterized protein n=1 Tax=Aphis glycines TaxID=307491 RepID=A0A6G0TS47_APHGL|nr:hypothetical protein AGLY_005883 [Aphis glycines]
MKLKCNCTNAERVNMFPSGSIRVDSGGYSLATADSAGFVRWQDAYKILDLGFERSVLMNIVTDKRGVLTGEGGFMEFERSDESIGLTSKVVSDCIIEVKRSQNEDERFVCITSSSSSSSSYASIPAGKQLLDKANKVSMSALKTTFTSRNFLKSRIFIPNPRNLSTNCVTESTLVVILYNMTPSSWYSITRSTTTNYRARSDVRSRTSSMSRYLTIPVVRAKRPLFFSPVFSILEYLHEYIVLPKKKKRFLEQRDRITNFIPSLISLLVVFFADLVSRRTSPRLVVAFATGLQPARSPPPPHHQQTGKVGESNESL